MLCPVLDSSSRFGKLTAETMATGKLNEQEGKHECVALTRQNEMRRDGANFGKLLLQSYHSALSTCNWIQCIF